MNQWMDGYVQANGIRIHYYRTGGDKPQVIFNHGAFDDGLCWTRVAKELEDDYDVIMFDARGHGLSDIGEGDYESETRAKDLSEAITVMGLDKPVVGGHSLGADVSMQLAALYPDQTRGIFLEDPPVVLPGEPMFGGDFDMEGDKVIKMMTRIMTLIKIMPIFLGKLMAKKMMPVSPEEEIIPWIMAKKRVNKDFFQSMKEMGAPNPDPFDLASKIAVPVLLFRGDRDSGAIVSEEVAGEMSKVIPGLEVVHLAGASHDIRRARFDGYMSSLKKFINNIYS